MNVQNIRFGTKNLPSDIFNGIAKEAAQYITVDKKDSNKSTQIRKFYDELVMFHDRIQATPKEDRQARFKELFPFIQMLNAKVAYAHGRKSGGSTLVSQEFVDVFSQCLNQIKIDDYETLKHCKLFIEAMIGFKKSME